MAMANAYSALKAELPRAQQAVLLANQRGWIRSRDATCADKSDRDLVGCLLAQTDQRRRYLAGEGPNRAPDAPRLKPAFFGEGRDGLYYINLVYPRIVKPRSPSEGAFNNAVHGLFLSKEALDYARTTEPPPAWSMPGYYRATYDVTYLDRRLAALVFSAEAYAAGAAHPHTWRESLVFDFSHGRELTFADIIGSPAEALPAIWRECKSRLKAKLGFDPEPWPPDDPTVEGYGSLGEWAPDKAGVDIMFDDPESGNELYECRLSWADLSPWLKPGGPLPPR